jgi:hypothetical protein
VGGKWAESDTWVKYWITLEDGEPEGGWDWRWGRSSVIAIKTGSRGRLSVSSVDRRIMNPVLDGQRSE